MWEAEVNIHCITTLLQWLQSNNHSEFYVPFPEVQGMNSSWQWYQKGLEVKTLDLTLHPYYGTYFPTRFDHLKLFDKWLKKYDGPKIC